MSSISLSPVPVAGMRVSGGPAFTLETGSVFADRRLWVAGQRREAGSPSLPGCPPLGLHRKKKLTPISLKPPLVWFVLKQQNLCCNEYTYLTRPRCRRKKHARFRMHTKEKVLSYHGRRGGCPTPWSPGEGWAHGHTEH